MKYVLIRSDNKSISNPMEKTEAISKIKEYDLLGISAYIISEDDDYVISSSSNNTLNVTNLKK